MSDSSVFAARRARYMEAIGPNAVAVIHSPPEQVRNSDVHFPFRQSSDMFYLTGFREPEATLVLRPGATDRHVVLFVRPRNRERETWDGRRAGLDGAVTRYGADVAYASGELHDKLPQLLGNFDHVYYSLGDDPSFDAIVAQTIAKLRSSEKRGLCPPRSVIDPREVLHEMRLRKTGSEIDHLRKAAGISAIAHKAAMRLAAPGVNEYELEAVINYTFRKHGGMGPGYNTIVGAGDNATILHYIENDVALADGDLVLIDAGCEYEFYTADITRTFPANGTFTDIQRRCYEIVLGAQKAGVAMAKPGETIDGIHTRTIEMLTEGMVELGLLQGPASERIADDSYKRFYMHRTSHWLGMDVHDAGAYTRDGTARLLEPGMIITVEPGLYIPSDADDVPAELRGIGIRIEDDVLITESGHENLTAATPKEVAEVEAACAARG